MKNLFAIYKNDRESAYDDFVIRRLSSSTAEKIDRAEKAGESLDKKHSAPQWMFFTYLPALALGILMIVAMIIASDGFKHAYEARGYLLYIGIALAIYGLACRVFIAIKKKRAAADPDAGNFIEEAKKLAAECYKELAVPEGAVDMDIGMPLVKKDKEGRDKRLAASSTSYLNYSFKVFKEGENICFADGEQVVGVPAACFKKAVRVDKHMYLVQWNKEEHYDDEKFASFNIKRNGYGAFHVRPFYALIAEMGGETFEITIPPYEMSAFSKLLQLEIVDESV